MFNGFDMFTPSVPSVNYFQNFGIRAIYQELFKVYPNQPNPQVISTVSKFWMNRNSNEPLDYILIFSNSECAEPHWHYISLGLSDLYGDNRLHMIDTSASAERLSGFGLELTFRLKKTPDTISVPPSWPANLLQSLAKYIFVSNNRVQPGDHIPWNKPLDNTSDSKVQHMLISLDCQLKKIKTALGHISFCQVVGVIDDELNVIQRWDCKKMLDLLQKDPQTGGQFLITDMDRKLSIFDLIPQSIEFLEEDLIINGSDLSGVDAEFSFREIPNIKTSLCLTMSDSLEFTRNLKRLDIRTSSEIAHHSSSSPFASLSRRVSPIILDGLELTFSLNSAKFLKLCMRDRLRHGRHFTFQTQELHLTFVSESVNGCFATKEKPYCIQGKWMQVLIENSLLIKVIESFKDLEPHQLNTMQLPQVFDFPEKNLRFNVNHTA